MIFVKGFLMFSLGVSAVNWEVKDLFLP